MITGIIDLHGEGVHLNLEISEHTVALNTTVDRDKVSFGPISENPVFKGLLDVLGAYFVSLTAQQAQPPADPGTFMPPEGWGEDPPPETPVDDMPLDGSPGPG